MKRNNGLNSDKKISLQNLMYITNNLQHFNVNHLNGSL